ncbi:MAG: hypothetical protein ACPG8W_25540, partial [Candidatus Promineifilaceae bacterium]
RITTVDSTNATPVLAANAIFNYESDNRRTPNSTILAGGLSAHQFDGAAWQIHAPDALDQANSTITVEAIALTGSSDWGFATSTPTAVTLSALSASSDASNLTGSLSADFLANYLTENLSAFSFANNLTENLSTVESISAILFANFLTIILTTLFIAMAVVTTVIVAREA